MWINAAPFRVYASRLAVARLASAASAQRRSNPSARGRQVSDAHASGVTDGAENGRCRRHGGRFAQPFGPKLPVQTWIFHQHRMDIRRERVYGPTCSNSDRAPKPRPPRNPCRSSGRVSGTTTSPADRFTQADFPMPCSHSRQNAGQRHRPARPVAIAQGRGLAHFNAQSTRPAARSIHHLLQGAGLGPVAFQAAGVVSAQIHA